MLPTVDVRDPERAGDGYQLLVDGHLVCIYASRPIAATAAATIRDAIARAAMESAPA